MKPTVIAPRVEMTTLAAGVTGVTATMTGATEISVGTSGTDMRTAMARGAKDIFAIGGAIGIMTVMIDRAATRIEIVDGVTETPVSRIGAIENMAAIAAMDGMMTGTETGVKGTIVSAVGMRGITIAGIGITIGVTETTIAAALTTMIVVRNERATNRAAYIEI